jgi:hypothetical protein
MKLITKELEERFLALGNQDGKGFDAIVVAKFFTPDSSWTWFVTEYDPLSREGFGYVIGMEAEWGYFSIDEIESVEGPLGLEIERDLHFGEKTLRVALKDIGQEIYEFETIPKETL